MKEYTEYKEYKANADKKYKLMKQKHKNTDKRTFHHEKVQGNKTSF